ncbi:MAG: hypothetical protein AAB307_00195 [Deltaproteobacteria bacterium]
MTFREEMSGVSAEIIDALGESATYDDGAGPRAITVVFDPAVIGVNPYTGESVNTAPIAFAKTSDVPNAKHKDTLIVAGIVYEILKAEDDGHGMTTLTLGKL